MRAMPFLIALASLLLAGCPAPDPEPIDAFLVNTGHTRAEWLGNAARGDAHGGLLRAPSSFDPAPAPYEPDAFATTPAPGADVGSPIAPLHAPPPLPGLPSSAYSGDYGPGAYYGPGPSGGPAPPPGR
jgi:hypothetical protein